MMFRMYFDYTLKYETYQVIKKLYDVMHKDPAIDNIVMITHIYYVWGFSCTSPGRKSISSFRKNVLK